MLKFHVYVQCSQDGGMFASFDQAFDQLESLPRLFIEPDGSFVWTGEEHGQPWQVDGNLIDRGDVLAYVELKGCCPAERLDELLRAVGWPEVKLVFQLPRRGVFLGEDEFRRLAATERGAI